MSDELDAYLDATGQAIAHLKSANVLIQQLGEHDDSQHSERLAFITSLIQEHVRLHLKELMLEESKRNLVESQKKATTEKLQKLVQAKEKEILAEKKTWTKRIAQQQTSSKRARTSFDEVMNVEEWSAENCKGQRYCDCCDRYSDYLISEWKLEMAFESTRNMTGVAKRKEIYRRLEYLVPHEYTMKFKRLAKGCITKCIQ